MVCRDECSSWRYRCWICGVDIHLECLSLTPCDAPTTRSRSVEQPGAYPEAVSSTFFCGYYNNAYGVPQPYGFGPLSHQQHQQQAGGGGGGMGVVFAGKYLRVWGT